MKLTIENKGSVSLATMSGEFGMEDAQRVAEEIQPMVAEIGSKLAIDMSGLNNISSAGLSELIAVVTRSRLTGSRVVLISPSPFVREVFSVTKLDEWFEIFGGVDDAVASLAG